MKVYTICLKYCFPAIFILQLLIGSTCYSQEEYCDKYFIKLKQRIALEGFNEVWVNKIYNNSKVNFDTKSVLRFFEYKEADLNYSQHSQKYSINKAKKYLVSHKLAFDFAEKRYKVNREIIAAIMLVETGFGKILGRRLVINTLSTMASLSEIEIQDMLWAEISTQEKMPDKLTKEVFLKWSAKKSKWAFKELIAFFDYVADEKIEPAEIKGSLAGAFGLPQFMPSNIKAYARDGNSDNKVDLFEHADAIMSIASYLNNFGWKPNLSRDKSYKVLFYYNHSVYYVNTLLDIQKNLKGS